jgi:hypothetical protein
MATIIKLTPHFFSPQGSINLDQVANVYVTVPLALIRYMDILVDGFQPSASSTEIKLKAAPAVKVLRETLAEVLSNGSKSQWRFSQEFVHRSGGGTQVHVAIGFAMQRRYMGGREDAVSVRVNCGGRPSEGRLYCEVVPFY